MQATRLLLLLAAMSATLPAAKACARGLAESERPRAGGRCRRRHVQAWRPLTVTINPLRNGATGGSFVSAVLADGRQVSALPETYIGDKPQKN